MKKVGFEIVRSSELKPPRKSRTEKTETTIANFGKYQARKGKRPFGRSAMLSPRKMAEKSSNVGVNGRARVFVDEDRQARAEVVCFHCGTACLEGEFVAGEKDFCCGGCLAVFELLTDNGLTEFYTLSDRAGVRIKPVSQEERFAFLDGSDIRQRLANFADAKFTRITLHLPAIHCIACVWLLENLFRLKSGIGQSQVNFQRKEITINFDHTKVHLSEIASLLASLGYEPDLKFSDLEVPQSPTPFRKLWLQVGVAGFAFGNNMLLSIAVYLGLDAFSGPGFKMLAGYLSMALAIPVVLYSAQDYWRSALISLRHKLLTIEVPIAAGIVAIFIQSSFEVITGHGEGYFDSLTGLLFFLLCGKLFQQKTYARLNFERDYKAFFPLAVTRKSAAKAESISLSDLRVHDHLFIRNGELIPADSRLIAGPAMIDYSFVTGESEPVEKRAGDYLYAGGRHIGGMIEVEAVKAVSQSYLTSLWNQEAFRKQKSSSLASLTNDYSQRFTILVIAISFGAAIFWAFRDPSRSLKAFTSVLIVACPCALALAAPFTLGTALRVLGRRNVFVKSAEVLETMAHLDTVVFDKTGTLTVAGAGSIRFEGETLNHEEENWLYSMTRHSIHPHAVRVGEAIRREHSPEPVRSFVESTGCGIEGTVRGREIWMGSSAWFKTRNLFVPPNSFEEGSAVHVAIDGRYRGVFQLNSSLRKDAGAMIQNLSNQYELALLSGDNARDRGQLHRLFGRECKLQFHQSPLDKLNFIRSLQRSGKTVMMVGDGLNDSGALKQSDVGVAVVEKIGAFSPASDLIIAADMVPRLSAVLRFAKCAVRTVRLSFGISAIYNVIGIVIAASGRLSPIVCAILMPVSSISVVAFACAATTWFGRHAGLYKNTGKGNS